MKKTICFVLTLVFIVALFGSCCKRDESGVLEVKMDSRTKYPKWMKHTNEIPYPVKRFVDEKLVGDTKTVRFMGQEYEIEYVESAAFGARDYSLRYYSVKGSGEGDEKQRQIVLSEDGTVVGVDHPSGLPIEYTAEDFADPERMREIVETAFGDEIDFAGYDQCTVTPHSMIVDPWIDSPIFGGGSQYIRFYSFFWYHSAGESRLSDSTKVVLSIDEGVTSIWMLNRLHVDFSAFSQTVKIEDCTALIEAKLDRIYNRDGRMTDYQIWDSIVCVLDGTFYLDCKISVKHKGTDDQTDSDWCELLIPLQN